MAVTLDPTRWAALTQRLGLDPSQDTFETLQRFHGQRHRHYHTAEHINACLRHLDERRDLAIRPDLIEIAIWFHDAVYKPFSKTNEADSAEMAKDVLRGQLPSADVTIVETMILLTQNHGQTDDPDTALMLDIDLSILATPPDIYDDYTRDIRREYRWVPGPMFRKGRAKMLRHFLAMDRIYKTETLRQEWDAKARVNMARELTVMGLI
ncbi:MAG: HD domain-containing protein [Litorimonas sp.]